MLKSIAAVLCQDINSPEVRRNARYGLQNYYKSVVDLLRYARPAPGFFDRNIDLIGLENLDRALVEGKGVILVSLHIGNLDLGIRALANAGYPVNAIVQNLENIHSNRFVQKPRASSGAKLINATDSFLQMLDVLKRNEVMALMIDGRVYEKGIPAKLGNKHIVVPGGMAMMALRTGARILPCGLVRSSNTGFVGIIDKPIQFNPTGDLVEDASELTQASVRALEGMARTFPDQWYIFHALIKDDVKHTD